MKLHPYLDSLYVRLALVLAAALVAGFATMGWLFHHHMEQDRNRGERSHMTDQIKLVERLLQKSPDVDLNDILGHRVYRGTEPDGTEPGPPDDLPPDLASNIASTLGHPVDIRRRVDHPRSGFWLRLAISTKEPVWLFMGPPGPFGGSGKLGGRGGPPRGLEPWALGLLVSFAVVFVGGMFLLWRVQVPLRELEKALRQFGPSAAPSHLQASGPREVRKLAEQFNRMTDRLQEYERDRQEMLAGVAHDLRAPVTRLRLQFELENSSRKAAMVHNLDSVDAIVDQFLLFARGAGNEALVELDMCAYLSEVTAPYDDQGVHLTVPNTDVILSIRPNSLRRALCNLIDNALEYGAPPVTVNLVEHSDQVVLTVCDHGTGIAASDRALALRPFTRLDDARASQGHCGLGLAIVARIAEAHGSRLELDNVPEGGLQARVIFPRP